MSLEFKAITPVIGLSGSVAVVGNSPKILGIGLGQEIDKHDEVIRFNGAVISDYVNDVGSKTTIVFVGIDLAYLFTDPYKRPKQSDDENQEIRAFNARKVVELFPSAKFVSFDPSNEERNNANKQYLSAMHLKNGGAKYIHYFEEEGPASAMYYHTANKDLEGLGLESRLSFGGPRTGFKTILRLVLSGVKPNLYGFDIDTSLEFANHYYDDVTNEKISEYKPHDIQGEMRALVEMHSKSLINIVC